jgi:RHS repeat-associated protein
MSCSDPVRLPSSALIAIPKGLPVLVGGPPAFDWATAAKAFFLRNKWTAGLLHQLVSLLPPGRLRNLAHMLTCTLTGHPVDVATGRLLSRAPDFELRGPIPLMFERYYSSAWAERDSPVGFGWSHTFDERIWLERGKVVYKTGDGRELEFHTYDLPGRTMQPGQELFYPIDRLTLRCLGAGRWEIASRDGLTRELTTLPGDSTVSHLTRIRNRLGQWVAFEYDASRLLDSVRTSEGRWLRFEHKLGRLRRVAVPYPHGDDGGWYDQVSFTYSEEGDLASAADSARHERTYRYLNHLLVEETDRDGVTFYFEYDGRDSTASCIRTWGDDQKGCDRLFFREITYDKVNRRTFVEDSLGHTTTYEMNLANAVIQIVDPHGAVTKREVDEHLWKVSETNALGAVTRFEHDARGNETKRVLPTGARFESQFNAEGQVVAMTDPFGVRWGWAYDSRSRLVASYNSAGEQVQIEHGELYARRVVRSDGSSVEFEHDAFGQVTRLGFPDGTSEERWYDRSGQLVKVRDGEGRAVRAAYDLEGRVVEVAFGAEIVRRFEYTPGGDLTLDAGPRRAERYGYRNFHQLAWREEGGERVAFRYDPEDRLLAVINEDGDAYTYKRDACGRIEEETTFEGRRTTYVRDALGNARMTFLPDKSARAVEYDVLSKPTRVQHPDGDEDLYSYDVLGNLESATNAAGVVRFERDARRRVVGERFGDDWMESTNDRLGARVGMKSSRGLLERIGRGPMGSVLSVDVQQADDAGRLGPAWQVAFARNGIGAEVARRMPGGVEAHLTRDAAGRPSSQVITRGGEQRGLTEYQWEGIDLLVARSEAGSGRTDFVHDARGRLAGARSAEGTTTWRAPGPTGNLYKREDRKDRRYAKGGVLLDDAGTTYGYDACGNVREKLTADGRSWTYVWNGAGMLARVDTPDGTSDAFAYDALRRRVSKCSDGKTTRWLWDGNVPIHEWQNDERSSREPVTTWVFEPESFAPLGKLTPEGSRFSIVTDHIGTPREMFDEAGRSAWKAQLDIYGVASVTEGETSDCPWRWPGQYEDAETGLFYNRFRYYDPARGDYVSQDPIDLHGCAAGAQLYSYTSDPLLWSDPLGLGGYRHPVTGVWITGGGNPKFDSVFNARIPAELRGASVSDYRQMTNATGQLQGAIARGHVDPSVFTPDQLAAIAAGEQRIPGYTWHHNHNGTQLQLVDRDIHAQTGHDGGRAKKDGGRC